MPDGDRPASQLTNEELQDRMRAARRRLGDRNVSGEERARLEQMMSGTRRELQLRQARNRGQPLPEGEGPDQNGGPPRNRTPIVNLPRGGEPNPAIERRRVDPQAEQRARSVLADRKPADRLSNEDLRRRLDANRNLLSSGDLPPEQEAELRRRLAEDRAVLRRRVSDQEAAGWRDRQGQGQGQDNRRRRVTDGPVIIVPPVEAQEMPRILADRRRARELDEIALNRRIQAYQRAVAERRLSDAEREDYVRYLEEDRAELRDRLREERFRRADELRRMRDDRDLDVDVDVVLGDVVEEPRSVIWAAEADDDIIEEQLVARPLEPLQRRYPREVILNQPETVMVQPEVRRAIPAVELDTVRFGFNEDFIREEEIANLDRIGKIIEKVVAAHPNEVYMIEGHTDAVGSDEANLDLSRRRAEAVKKALTEYYVIAPENLATVGLGERYLKIPTPDEEPENRRVTIRRVTPLVQN
jgi:outer membrane protein OmpA-like peptidoglycan-associated protein